jgi:hypothetical protein
MIEYLKRPSPVLEKISSRIILVLCISTFVFLFLITFKPFGIDNSFKIPVLQVCLGYALLAFVVFNVLMLWVNPWFLAKYKERFTLGVEIGVIFSFVTLLGIVNGSYSLFVLNKEYLTESSVSEVFLLQLMYTHAVALFPIILVLFFFELRERSYYERQSELIRSERVDRSTNAKLKEKIQISGDGSSEQLQLFPSDFIFAKASGNYVEVFHFKENVISKEVIRITLSGLMNQLIVCEDWIFQTHRSYVINLHRVSKIEGNAQGYKLTMIELDEPIPVSRGKITEFNAVMNSI